MLEQDVKIQILEDKLQSVTKQIGELTERLSVLEHFSIHGEYWRTLSEDEKRILGGL